LKKALSGGVTTVGAGPGSASIISGTFLAVKLYGTCVDDMCLKNNVAMKCALGENPKNTFGTKCDSTRITTAAKLREFLFGTKIYMEKKKQASEETRKTMFDMKYEAMIPVMEGKMPLKIHVHRADDICTAIRIAKEFNLKATLENDANACAVAEW
jgi:imidazolonepropionase-like amidohydrolase